jgi:hypothetical protein
MNRNPVTPAPGPERVTVAGRTAPTQARHFLRAPLGLAREACHSAEFDLGFRSIMPEPKPTLTAPPWLKPTVDYGPLMVFLAFYFATDLLTATAALIAVWSEFSAA